MAKQQIFLWKTKDRKQIFFICCKPWRGNAPYSFLYLLPKLLLLWPPHPSCPIPFLALPCPMILHLCLLPSYCHLHCFKGTVSRDFLVVVFFMNQFPQRHRWQILPPVSLVLLIPVANSPPVSTIPAANTGVNDTGGKFAAGVNDTGGKLPPVSTTMVVNNRNNIRLQIP